jgi:hypothetical protein
MRTLVFVVLASCLAWSVGDYVAANPEAPPAPHAPTHSYLTDIELSRDNGDITNAWCYYTGANSYTGDQYDIPSGYYNLMGIKYYVWTGWPDDAFQGFAVACWKMEGGTPGAVVWPTDGNPIYNPNTGGNWITQEVNPPLLLQATAPNGFLVGIGQLYNNPACDGFGVDDTGAGAYDWTYYSGVWGAAPYGKGSARALVDDWIYPWWGVEPATLGSLRALYR